MASDNGALRQPAQAIRVLAVALLIYRDHLLCAEGFDAVKQQQFYRPLGGGVEFGETVAEAVARELREETGVSIEVRANLGAVENLFTFQGAAGHEVVFELLCVPAAGSEPPDLSPLTCHEEGAPFTAHWLPLAEVLAGTHRVYPEGLPDRLAKWINTL
jgi:ADP-ribose pyrophosphatase YjhB (NUDIX family)